MYKTYIKVGILLILVFGIPISILTFTGIVKNQEIVKKEQAVEYKQIETLTERDSYYLARLMLVRYGGSESFHPSNYHELLTSFENIGNPSSTKNYHDFFTEFFKIYEFHMNQNGNNQEIGKSLHILESILENLENSEHTISQLKQAKNQNEIDSAVILWDAQYAHFRGFIDKANF